MESRLPGWVAPHWYANRHQAVELADQAEIGWFDFFDRQAMRSAIEAATRLKWLNSLFAGVEQFPLGLLQERAVMLTNGAGINAIPIAEYVVMMMLSHAKGYRDVVRAQDRHEWLQDSPGKRELYASKALILGYGAIGKEIAVRLEAFGVEITRVSRSAAPGTLGPDQWRGQLAEFDWIVLAVPATLETNGLIGAAELAAMGPQAVVVNIARGSVIDQPSLVAALAEGRIAGALLDVTTPEPLPQLDPLWDHAEVTMHLSGRAQSMALHRAADRFVANLARYEAGELLEPLVDYTCGY
ncbi:MAG: D-2-hydroxyacid dehydrogenase [Novosphingobium sp.]|uniref:D-2-hydroxyacid dehydrogenase n=1 Tax=Novosphingobium sp. TaxID=1874826 RepID=UPI0032BC9D1E